MQVYGEADCFWFIWPPFSGWSQKFHNTDIVSLASPRVILELPSVVFSVCQNRYQKLVFCWEVFWQMQKLQIYVLVSRCDHLNISIMYSIFDWKEFELLSYRWAFLKSTKITASCRTKCFGKDTSSVYGIADIKQKGTSSVYTVSEIKWENPISSLVLHE